MRKNRAINWIFSFFTPTKIIILFGFIIPYILIYKVFFTNTILSWGDAPYFYQENLKELFNKPFLWDVRNDNFGSDQGLVLWLYLPTFLFGLINHFTNLQSELLIRLIFYFPATILSFIGAWLLIKKYIKSNLAVFIGSFLYSFNTYILSLIDGGQIGIALSFSIFPFVILTLTSYLNNRDKTSYLLAVISLFLLSNTDLRIFLISILYIIILEIFRKLDLRDKILFKKRYLFDISIVLLSVILLDAFWLLPLINLLISNNITSSNFNIQSDGSNLINLIDSLLLFQPHFPLNEFGKVSPPPFYFVFIPIVLFFGLLIKRSKLLLSFGLVYLIFVFFAKGGNDPLGEIYIWLVNSLPIGVAFRDSSKFFIPLLLSASILIAISTQILKEKIRNSIIFFIIFSGIYLFLLLLISPAIFGKMTGVLKTTRDNNFDVIYANLKKEDGFFRTLWFDERLPLAFSSWDKQALSANNLYKERPFASMINGRYDLYNFLHNEQLKSWLDLLGVKYVFITLNERKKTWSDLAIKEREEFRNFVSKIPFFTKINWPVKQNVYSTESKKPHIFAQKKIFLVIGGEQIYDKLFQIPSFSLAANGLLFLEDGKFNSNLLQDLKPESAILLLDGKTGGDLAMVFLQNKMVSVSSATDSQWAIRDSSQYLLWKSELQERGINTKEFDFSKGIAFSSVSNEKIKFQLDIPKSGDYILALRFTNSTNSAGLKVNMGDSVKTVRNDNPSNFKWYINEPIKLTKGKKDIEIENLGDLVILNTLMLIDKKELKYARRLADDVNNKFVSLTLNQSTDRSKIESLLDKEIIEVPHKQINPTLYNIEIPLSANWIVFSDHYHPNWILQDGKDINSQPLYSMINGFPIVDKNQKAIIYFKSQDYVEQGIMISLISALSIVVITGMMYVYRK